MYRASWFFHNTSARATGAFSLTSVSTYKTQWWNVVIVSIAFANNTFNALLSSSFKATCCQRGKDSRAHQRSLCRTSVGYPTWRTGAAWYWSVSTRSATGSSPYVSSAKRQGSAHRTSPPPCTASTCWSSEETGLRPWFKLKPYNFRCLKWLEATCWFPSFSTLLSAYFLIFEEVWMPGSAHAKS